MPVVPVYEPTQRLRGLPQERYRAADGTVGARALAAAGQRFANTLDKVAEQVDVAAAKQLDLEYQDFERRTLYGDGETKGYLAMQAADALGARAATEEALRAKVQELLGKAQSPRQRQMLADVLARRVDSSVTQTQQHYVRQADVYNTQTAAARQQAAEFGAFRERENPERFVAEMQTALAEVAALWGPYGPDVVAQKKLEATTRIHAMIVDDLARTDAVSAMDWLDRHEEQMVPTVAAKLRNDLQPALDEQEASDFVDALLGVGVGVSPGAVPDDNLFRAVQIVESRNRNFDDKGRVVTSPVGARYAAQVMPATSRDPGFGVRPAQSDTPEEWNRVGREYLAALRKHYGSDTLALAAYNAGPRTVDGWLKTIGDPRTGSMTEAQWTARVPWSETRKYVRKVWRAAGVEGPRQKPEQTEIGPILAAIDTDPSLTPQQKQRARAIAVNRANMNRQLFNEAQANLLDRAWQAVERGETPSPSIMAALDRKHRGAIESALRGEAVQANGELMMELTTMYYRDPERFARLDPVVWKGLVTTAEDARLRRSQAVLLAKEDEQRKTRQTQLDTLAQSAAREAAQMLGGKRSGPEYIMRLRALEDAMREQLDAWREQNDGFPSRADVRVMQDNVTKQVVVEKPGWFTSARRKRAFETTIEDVPDSFRKDAVKIFREENGRDPTDREVLEMFRRSGGVVQ